MTIFIFMTFMVSCCLSIVYAGYYGSAAIVVPGPGAKTTLLRPERNVIPFLGGYVPVDEHSTPLLPLGRDSYQAKYPANQNHGARIILEPHAYGYKKPISGKSEHLVPVPYVDPRFNGRFDGLYAGQHKVYA